MEAKDKHIEELQRQVDYYRKLSDEVAGQNIRSDSQISLLKRKLTQKENGFTILSALHDSFGQQIFEDEFFNNTLMLINTTLKMDKTVVLWKSPNNFDSFIPKFNMGFNRTEVEKLKQIEIDFQQEEEVIQRPFIKNKRLVPNEVSKKISAKIQIPYFIAVPIRTHGKIVAWIISGREKEAWPFYPTLDEGDLDTMVSISGFLEAGISNANLYYSLEKANEELEAYNQELEKRVAERTKDLRIKNQELTVEKKRSEDLLLNILPEETAEELKKYGFAKAKLQENATVMFTDFVNFTKFSSSISSEELVSELDHCFRNFDAITTKYRLEKIKTIGDAHMSACGVTGDGGDVADVIRAGIEMRDFVQSYAKEKPKHLQEYFQIRVGINTGPVVAGVVGLKKFSFDIWGDTVNTADRIQSGSVAGKVNVSESTYLLTKDLFDFENRGKISAKNKGMIPMYFVENLKKD
ncbi:adenylate/guanylate cyclase domain-containing protein [Algoriphagus machipongonensis]|uniref:Adenylate/guanylate cyclase catalytic domain protein n=1 Tax=Algoriphagus machipongonensis TaxID=388413 RepID=A3HVA1_9BACT|nr:adenylate/guanylate cyclase domain-containing protein [Algoriphagus machipongonensis]EAZ82073.1 adenylate/guanylate cyclase catalytic domain protein [Algoriphagus machipongonensis]